MVSQTAKSVPVSEIVDFEPELNLFLGILAHPSERCLMFIQAPGGRGKTCLLRLMRRHCKEQGIPCCWVNFRGESYDNPHLTLAREICDQLAYGSLKSGQVREIEVSSRYGREIYRNQ